MNYITTETAEKPRYEMFMTCSWDPDEGKVKNNPENEQKTR